MSNEAMREAFETYMSGDGRFPKAVERDGSGGYLLGTARTGWADWQAAWRAACEHCAQKCERIGEGEPRIEAFDLAAEECATACRKAGA